MPKQKASTPWLKRTLMGVKAFFVRQKTRIAAYAQARPYRTLRPGKFRIKPVGSPLPTIRGQLAGTFKAMRSQWKNLFLLTLLYAVVTFVIVGGLGQGDFVDLKETALQVITGDFGAIGTTSVLFLGAIANAVTVTGTEYQQLLGGIVTFIFWLAAVWLVRMGMAGNKVRVRDALYNCCAPIVPSFLVMLAIAVQSLPAVAGVFVFSVSISEGYLNGGVEAMMFGLGAVLLCVLSLYWVSASLVGLVMVSLPQTYPWQALAGASRLVIGQRWKLMKLVAALFVALLLLWVIILFPSLLLDGWLRWDWLPLIPIVVQLLGALSLTFSATYVYRLYRSLL
jgi:hypothetical protein